MRIRSIVFVLVTSVIAVFGIQAPADAAAKVQIVKVYVDSPGSDTGSNTSLNAEWVRIKNNASHSKTLTGWTLRDKGGIHVFTFPAFTLKAGAKVRVHTGPGTNTAHNLYWGLSNYVWNNTGDKATLKKASGKKVDVCKFSGAGSSIAC